MRPARTRLLKLGLALATLGAVLFLAARQVDVRTPADQLIARFREAGPFAFFTAMALLPAVGFPLSAFTVAAGPVFGPVMGVGNVVLCAILAVTINVAVSYWLATRALRPLVERVVRWLGYRLPEVQPHAAWSLTLVVRILPGPPFFLQSYLLGLARAPFAVYMIVSTIVPASYLAGTIVFTDAMLRGDRWAMAGAVAIFLVAGAVLHQLRRRMKPSPVAVAPAVPTSHSI